MTKEMALNNNYMFSMHGENMKKKLCREMNLDPEYVDMDAEQMFRNWLEWEGISGYDQKIIRALRDCGFVVEPVI